MMKNILFLAFYFSPFKGVGSKRAIYWFNKLEEDNRFNVDLVTSVNQDEYKKKCDSCASFQQ